MKFINYTYRVGDKFIRVRKLQYFFLLTLFFSSGSLLAQIDPDRIEIIRDKWGVPHIYAPTDAEVAYGLAWAHAEDDFYDIQLTMTAAKQMLGRYLGKDGAAGDYLVGLMRFEEVIEKNFDQLSPDYLKVLDGYVQGINAYASLHPKEVLVKKAFPITVKEALRGYLLSLAAMDGAGRVVGQIVGNDMELAQESMGSNAFAISPSLSTTEEVYLAVNAHQPYEGPAAWYEAHLVSDEGWNMMGGLFPGGATVFHGTNENLGWAHTVNFPDKVDVFQLEMDPESENRYRIDDEWFELDKRVVKLKVKILPGIRIPIKREVYWSKYGPTLKNKQGVFAFHMAILDNIGAPEQWYRMNKASNWSEFRSALDQKGIPSFNIVYGDREGNIFYVGNSNSPYRNPEYNWWLTLPGNTAKTLPGDYHPFSDLPQVMNPKSGYVYNTNHSALLSTGPKDFMNFNSYDSTMGYRVWHNNRSWRVQEIMKDKNTLTWEEFWSMKFDQQLPDSLCYLIDINPLMEVDASRIKKGREVLEIIQKWDRKALVNSVGPAQLMIMQQHLNRKIGFSYPWLKKPSPIEMLESLAYAEDYLLKHFGKLEITLGEYHFLVRGEREVPVWGMNDVLSAMLDGDYKNGRKKVRAGESYIMMIRYPKYGLPIIETINVYGASDDPDSPHFDDQMDMFVNQELKPMTLDIDEVRKNAERIYPPK